MLNLWNIWTTVPAQYNLHRKRQMSDWSHIWGCWTRKWELTDESISVFVCVCLPMCFSQGASECFICHHKDRDKGCRSQDTQRCSQLCVLGFRDVVTKYNISPVWKMLEEIFTSVNQIRILRCDWIFLQWHHFVLKNSWDCVPHKSLQSNFSI